MRTLPVVVLFFFCLQEIDELLGQNLTDEDEEAIAAELDSILLVSLSHYGAASI